jgi:hypothetical protein
LKVPAASGTIRPCQAAQTGTSQDRLDATHPKGTPATPETWIPVPLATVFFVVLGRFGKQENASFFSCCFLVFYKQLINNPTAKANLSGETCMAECRPMAAAGSANRAPTVQS